MGRAAQHREGFFENTIWSTVLKAKDGEEAVRLEALGRLLERYRRPIILEIRHKQQCDALTAEDLAQQFIHDWLKRDFLKNLTRDEGRFRSFVRTSIHNFLRDIHSRQTAGKRGGGMRTESLDAIDEEGRPFLTPAATCLGPEETMDIAWARQILQEALAQLERECREARRGSLFGELKPYLTGETEALTYATVGARLGMTEGSIKVASHRLRQRLAELVREEVRQTVGSREEWQDELRYLISLFGQ